MFTKTCITSGKMTTKLSLVNMSSPLSHNLPMKFRAIFNSMNKNQVGLNDRQQPICTHSSIFRASVWQWEGGSGLGWINPAAKPWSFTLQLCSRQCNIPAAMLKVELIFYCVGLWHPSVQRESQRKEKKARQMANPQFLAKQSYICQTERSRLKEPRCHTHLSAESEIIELEKH